MAPLLIKLRLYECGVRMLAPLKITVLVSEPFEAVPVTTCGGGNTGARVVGGVVCGAGVASGPAGSELGVSGAESLDSATGNSSVISFTCPSTIGSSGRSSGCSSVSTKPVSSVERSSAAWGLRASSIGASSLGVSVSATTGAASVGTPTTSLSGDGVGETLSITGSSGVLTTGVSTGASKAAGASLGAIASGAGSGTVVGARVSTTTGAGISAKGAGVSGTGAEDSGTGAGVSARGAGVSGSGVGVSGAGTGGGEVGRPPPPPAIGPKSLSGSASVVIDPPSAFGAGTGAGAGVRSTPVGELEGTTGAIVGARCWRQALSFPKRATDPNARPRWRSAPLQYRARGAAERF